MTGYLFMRWTALLLGCGLQFGCGAAPPQPAPAAAEWRQALAPCGHLRIAVYRSSPTSLVRAPGQDERGLSVALVVVALQSGRADMTITNATPVRAALRGLAEDGAGGCNGS